MSIANTIASEPSATVDRTQWPYKMKDLCDLAGVPRQVVHFYIQQGLLPEGKKTGKNMAFYNQEHVDRVLFIRKLQHERFLPLKAIRAILDERDEVFTPAQKTLLAEVKQKINRSFTEKKEAIAIAEVLKNTKVTQQDVLDLREQGMLGVTEDEQGNWLIAREDAWVIDLWHQLRSAGFTSELGFTPKDLGMLEQVVSTVFRYEAGLFSQRLSHLPAERVAQMVEVAVPLVSAFFVKYHESRVKNFFATI